MANYLQKDAARPVSSQSSGVVGTGSIPDVDGMYTTEITASDDGVTSFVFKGYIPEDFNIDMDANWSPNGGINEAITGAVDSATGGAASAISNATLGGKPVPSRQGSYHTWDGPSYLSLTLPFELMAWSSGQTDVLDPMVAMMSLISPREQAGPEALQDSNGQGGGLLLPPGLSPAEAVLDSGNREFAGRRISCRVGKFFHLDGINDPCLITNVSTAIDSQFEDQTGIPISAVMNVQLVSYFPMTDLAVKRIFRAGGQ